MTERINITDEMLDELASRAVEYQKAGMSKRAARRRAKNDFYWAKEFGWEDPRLSRRVQMAYQRHSFSPPLIPDAVAETSGSGYAPMTDMTGYIEHINPAVGEEIVLNLHYFVWKFGKPNDGAYRHIFINPKSSLLQKGWGFEIVNRSGREFRMKVTARPVPPVDPQQESKDKEIDELRRMIASFGERLEALSNSNGKH